MIFTNTSLIQRGWVQETESTSFETASNEVKPIETFRRYKHYANDLREKITPARKRTIGSALVSPHTFKDNIKQIRTSGIELKNDQVVPSTLQPDVKAVASDSKALIRGKTRPFGLGYKKSSHKIPTSISKAPDLLRIEWYKPFYAEKLGPFNMDKHGNLIENDAITPVDTAAWVHDEEYSAIYSKYGLKGDATPSDWAIKVTSTDHLFQFDSIEADARLISNSWSNMIEGISTGFYSSKEGLKTFTTDLAWSTAITTSHVVLIGMRALSAGVGLITSTISGALTGLAGLAERNLGFIGKGIGYVLRGVDKVLSAAELVTRVVIGAIGVAAMAVVGAVGLAAGYLAGKAVEFGAAIVDSAGELFSAVGRGVEAVGDFIGGAVEAVSDFFGGIGEAVGDAIDSVGEFFGGSESEGTAGEGRDQESSGNETTGGEGREGGDNDGWCFITGATLTSIGGPDSRYELDMLRTFRDTYVINRKNGIFLIREYYVVAKDIVLRINQEVDSQSVYKGIYYGYLIHALDAIERRQFSRALRLYEGMVNELSERYGVSKPIRLPIEPINRYAALAA